MTKSSTNRLRKKRSARGYTLLEVSAAMTVMAIASSSVVAIINTSIVGGMQARRIDLASKIADMWIERLRGDALNWNANNAITTAHHHHILAANVQVAAIPAVPTANWTRPWGAATVAPGRSPFFDQIGREMTGDPSSIQPTFCTHVRMEAVRFGAAGATVAEANAIRAEVRVFFRKDMGVQAAGCDALAGGDPEDPNFMFVYATTIIRESGI